MTKAANKNPIKNILLKRPSRKPKYKQLQKSFKKGTWFFELVDRTHTAAIYKKSSTVFDFSCFEVFKIKTQEESLIKMGGSEIHLEAKELYPGNNSFGVYAWSLVNLETAKERLKQIS